MAILRMQNIQEFDKPGKWPFSTDSRRLKAKRSACSHETVSLERFGQFKKNPRFFYNRRMSDGDMCKLIVFSVGAKYQ